jgi:abhydrolase domain-containing protein 17
MKRRAAWSRLLLAVCGLYVLMAAAVPMLADSLIYHPSYGSRRAPDGMQKIRAGTDEIAVLHLPNPKARYTLWFFHGNAEDLGNLEPFLLTLRDRGYAVFAFDYPGYGHSTGKPSEPTLYASARAARTHLRDVLKVPAERTVIYGRSLGGGPAVQMAVEERPAGLILQSAFVSAFRVVTRWRLLPFDPFQNLKKIPRVACPVLVMHGRADEVIPFRHGEALFAAAKEPKRSLWISGAAHNDFISVAGRSYWDALREFSAVCAQTGGASP